MKRKAEIFFCNRLEEGKQKLKKDWWLEGKKEKEEKSEGKRQESKGENNFKIISIENKIKKRKRDRGNGNEEERKKVEKEEMRNVNGEKVEEGWTEKLKRNVGWRKEG